jgi:hypothetical protein
MMLDDLSDDEQPPPVNEEALEKEMARILDGLTITRDEVIALSNVPQRTPEWFKARQGRISGSIIASCVGLCKYTTPDERLHEYLWKVFKGNKYCEFGTRVEPYIQAEIELYFQLNGDPDCTYAFLYPGTVVCYDTPYLSYSPDGVVICTNKRTGAIQRILIEIKARYNGNDYPKGRIPTGYYCQIMLGMHVLNLEQTLFAVLLGEPSEKTLKLELYQRDTVFINELLLPKTHAFYMDRLLPALARKNIDALQML